jgi:hypothetical protein
MPTTLNELYETDFTAWGEQQVAALRRLVVEHPEIAEMIALDTGHLIEEVEALASTAPKALAARLKVLLMHLAKRCYQPDHRTGSWEAQIKEQRRAIGRLIKKNPVVKPRVPALFAEAWEETREDAADETGLPLATFPEACPWTLEQTLDRGFLPD